MEFVAALVEKSEDNMTASLPSGEFQAAKGDADVGECHNWRVFGNQVQKDDVGDAESHRLEPAGKTASSPGRHEYSFDCLYASVERIHRGPKGCNQQQG